MKAIIQNRYGPAEEVLEFHETSRPVTTDDEVLLRIQAASIHVGDCLVMQGLPKVMRSAWGLRRPKHPIPGTDVAGVVEAVGKDVTTLQPGDEVFGWCKGAFATHASVPADQLIAKPSSMTFEQAAAIGTSAFAALHALRDHGDVKEGQKVMVTGASGGVGTFAVQIAKALGAEVTGVCSTRNLEMVRSIGADDVIDYTTEDFTRVAPKFDVILDNVGKRSFSDTRRPLAPAGVLLSSGAPVSGWFGGVGHVIKALVQSRYVRQQAPPFISTPNKEDLATLKELAEAGKITPVMDRTYPLSDGAMAMAHVSKGHAQGKTVITVEGPAGASA